MYQLPDICRHPHRQAQYRQHTPPIRRRFSNYADYEAVPRALLFSRHIGS